jgi:hypothetical protein
MGPHQATVRGAAFAMAGQVEENKSGLGGKKGNGALVNFKAVIGWRGVLFPVAVGIPLRHPVPTRRFLSPSSGTAIHGTGANHTQGLIKAVTPSLLASTRLSRRRGK